MPSWCGIEKWKMRKDSSLSKILVVEMMWRESSLISSQWTSALLIKHWLNLPRGDFWGWLFSQCIWGRNLIRSVVKQIYVICVYTCNFCGIVDGNYVIWGFSISSSDLYCLHHSRCFHNEKGSRDDNIKGMPEWWFWFLKSSPPLECQQVALFH